VSKNWASSGLGTIRCTWHSGMCMWRSKQRCGISCHIIMGNYHHVHVSCRSMCMHARTHARTHIDVAATPFMLWFNRVAHFNATTSCASSSAVWDSIVRVISSNNCGAPQRRAPCVERHFCCMGVPLPTCICLTKYTGRRNNALDTVLRAPRTDGEECFTTAVLGRCFVAL
jgi:hypothetical protein